MLSNLSSLVSLCKRRGVIFPSSEIYGGLSACWDYGPLGVQLKRNVQEYWWQEMTCREDVVGLDSSILMHPKIWEASGHLSEFSDPLVDCRNCKYRFRMENESTKVQCPKCGSSNLTEPRPFHLMFQTQAGPMQEDTSVIYLRPETAQGIYVNFLNVCSSMRKKIPFGVAQVGKAFRNEITVGNFIFRAREFEQMEMQFFVHPSTADSHFEYWKEKRQNSLLTMGIPKDKLRVHSHSKYQLAHYAHKAVDLEFLFPMGWKELEGIHHRGDFDLTQHQKFSRKKISYTDIERKESYVPYVIETSIGLDRLILALLCSAYHEEKVKEDTRTFLRLLPKFSPVQVAVLPLQKQAALKDLALKITNDLRKNWRVEYDDSGSIGKRYRRQDEIGTPFCVTIDFDSLSDQCMTCRHRDTMNQDRIALSSLAHYLADKSSIF